MKSKYLKYKISDIFLGEADGEDEALTLSNFHDFYYDYDKITEKAMLPLKYLVLGKKGTGKTLLGEFINSKLNDNVKSISKIIPFNEFRIHTLRELKSEDVPPNEYIPIWHYIILIELSKLILENNTLSGDENYKKIKTFISKNYQKLILTQNSESDIKKLKNFNSDFIAPITNDESIDYNSFIHFIPHLEDSIIKLLDLDKDFSYTLILDKLDDRFDNSDLYKNSLISLIKALDDFNKKLLRMKYHVKIMALIRSDIFSLINDTDLNKREQSNSVKIDWGDKADYNSPLFDLIIKKVRASIPAFERFSREDILYKLFPPKISMNRHPVKTDQFLLSRTLFRPRDIITYLKLVIDKNPDATYFKESAIIEAERAYSEYFIKELSNEMNGHVDNEIINEIIQLMIKFGKFTFNYDDIQRFEEKNKILTKISLDEALKIMFDFSLIGNFKKNQANQYRFAWKHRHDRIEVDFDKEFRLHYGLWRYFNV